MNVSPAIPVLSNAAYASLVQSLAGWSCPACSRPRKTYHPSRHVVPGLFDKCCPCGAQVTYHLHGQTWHFTVAKDFRMHGKRWHVQYMSWFPKTLFFRYTRDGREYKEFDGTLVSVRRFKNLRVYL